jgi:hypothetical protein
MKNLSIILGVFIVLGKMFVMGVIPTLILMLLSHFFAFSLPPIFFIWTISAILCLPVLMKLDEEPTSFY